MRPSPGWTGFQTALRQTPLGIGSRQPLVRRQLRSQATLLRRIPRTSQSARAQHRYASSQAAADAGSTATRVKNLVLGTSIALGLTFSYLYITDTRATVHQWLVVPIIRTLYPDAEDAHHVGTKASKVMYDLGIHPRERGDPDAKGDLKVEVFGHVSDNPIGISAGLDKNAEVPSPLFAVGPGIVEVGGITPSPQEGNPKPRVWRITSQNALINRYGLNSEGADNVATRLRQRLREFAYSIGLGSDPEAERQVLSGEAGVPPGSSVPGRSLAVQVAKSKGTPDQDIDAVAGDYVYGVQQMGKYADISVVNVSSPNTPGLRSSQQTEPLMKILTAVVNAAQNVDRSTKPRVMVKVSPDEDSEEQVRGICSAVYASGVDGIIVGNTTKKRPDPLPKGYASPAKEEQILLEQGGYSGPQLFERTVSSVKKYRQALDTMSHETSAPKQEDAAPSPSTSEGTPDITPGRVQASIERDEKHSKPLTPESKQDSQEQPLVRLPERNSPSSESEGQHTAGPALSASTHAAQGTGAPANPHTSGEQKVIFATGGIANGKQALEVSNAGASVAMVYTAMVYGGVGTVSRIKREMREEISHEKK